MQLQIWRGRLRKRVLTINRKRGWKAYRSTLMAMGAMMPGAGAIFDVIVIKLLKLVLESCWSSKSWRTSSDGRSPPKTYPRAAKDARAITFTSAKSRLGWIFHFKAKIYFSRAPTSSTQPQHHHRPHGLPPRRKLSHHDHDGTRHYSLHLLM